jgi:hypothetical protein
MLRLLQQARIQLCLHCLLLVIQLCSPAQRLVELPLEPCLLRLSRQRRLLGCQPQHLCMLLLLLQHVHGGDQALDSRVGACGR